MAKDDRGFIAKEVIKLFPPIVQRALMDRQEFLSRFDLRVNAKINFGGQLSFGRSSLFSAIRKARLSDALQRVQDDSGKAYALSAAENHIVLKPESGEGEVHLPSFWFLAPSKTDRLRAFEEEVSRHHLHGPRVEEWRQKLRIEISDDDVDDLLLLLRLTPDRVAEEIANEISTGSSKVATLAPRGAQYYDQLIGYSKDCRSFGDYLQDVLPGLMASLATADPLYALSRSLLLCGHSSISEALVPPVVDDAVVEYFERVANSGDRFTQVALIELGARILEQNNRLEQPLVKMAQQIADDDVSSADSRLRLTCSLFIFVDGELSRLRTFDGQVPAIRRLATIAQASLIERELISAGISSGQFADWATSGRGQRFFLQTLSDLRLEPRWLPDFMNPTQLKAEFISRIVGAVDRHKERLPDGSFRALVIGENAPLRSRMEFPFSFLPGPLEGAQDSPADLPEEIARDLEELQSRDTVDANHFAGLVNSALVFKILPIHTKLVPDTLRRVKHQVTKLENSSQSFSLLSGLAVTAAVVRDPDLAAEVRVLARVVRRLVGIDLEPDDLMRIGLLAAASEFDLEKWCDTVGQWFVELAFEDMSPEKAAAIHTHLFQLCSVEPALWRTCSKAEAALRSASERAA